MSQFFNCRVDGWDSYLYPMKETSYQEDRSNAKKSDLYQDSSVDRHSHISAFVYMLYSSTGTCTSCLRLLSLSRAHHTFVWNFPAELGNPVLFCAERCRKKSGNHQLRNHNGNPGCRFLCDILFCRHQVRRVSLDQCGLLVHLHCAAFPL